MSATSGYRCLIVEDDTFVSMGLRSLLEKLGHTVIGDVSTAPQAEALYREKYPDLVLMDIQLDGADGIDVATNLLKHRACPVIIISAFSDKELIDRAAAAGVFGYLVKPINIAALTAQIEVAVMRFRERMQLLAEKEALSQNLETRKLVEKAKGIIMKRGNLSEPEAHRRLQTESQKRRQSLAELAKRIIESEEVIGGE